MPRAIFRYLIFVDKLICSSTLSLDAQRVELQYLDNKEISNDC